MKLYIEISEGHYEDAHFKIDNEIWFQSPIDNQFQLVPDAQIIFTNGREVIEDVAWTSKQRSMQASAIQYYVTLQLMT